MGPRPAASALRAAAGLRLAVLGALAILATSVASHGVPECRVAHRDLGESPALAWSSWARNVQGIAHDDANWFVTNMDTLYRVPLAVGLENVDRDARVRSVPIPDALRERGYDHFGDLTAYEVERSHYLCVPMEGPGQIGALAFFRGDDLAFLGASDLPGGATWAPLCAIDAGGFAVVPIRGAAALARYRVDWRGVARAAPDPLEPAGTLSLETETATAFSPDNYGGAAFSADGTRLYALTGYLDDHACPVWQEWWNGGCPVDPEGGGLHVFDVSAVDGGVCEAPGHCRAVRVDRSINHPAANGQAFTYQYRGTRLLREEPEGLTWWDLDGTGSRPADGARGQLHALMLANGQLSVWDRVSVRHYGAAARCAGPPKPMEPRP